MIKKLPQHKTWIELDPRAIRHNVKAIRTLLKPKTELFAVVKSNAYGHGLFDFAKVAGDGVDGFCVDSVIEGFLFSEYNFIALKCGSLPLHNAADT